MRGGKALSCDVYSRDQGTAERLGDGRTRIDPDGVGPATSFNVGNSPDETSYRSDASRFNGVLRWEYRNGSAMYLVWQHASDAARPLDGVANDGPWALPPATHGLLFKIAHRFGR